MNESKKNPVVAAVLNFSFLGLGYLYVGEWLGAALVIYNLILAFSLTLIFFTDYISEINSTFYKFGAFEMALGSSLFIISVIFAWHAYGMVKEMNEMISA